MNIASLQRLSPRTIVLAAAAALLLWLVVIKSLAAYLADAAPNAALWFNARQPEALANLADRSLNSALATSAPSRGNAEQATEPRDGDSADGQASNQKPATGQAGSGNTSAVAADRAAFSIDLSHAFDAIDPSRSVDLATVRGWAVSALVNDPLNARALRVLGQAATAAGNGADASKFMRTAARLSLHESIAVYWMMRKSMEAGDNEAAISYADALLRTDPSSIPYVAPALAHLAEQRASSGLVKAVLEKNPPWRDLFFSYLPDSISDARTPLELLLALKNSKAPPDASIVDQYVKVLVAHKFYDLAYYTWLQFLPADELHTAGLLFNGTFDTTPSGSPFDWTITQGPGVTVDIVPNSDRYDGHALMVDFLYGRVEYHSVNELVLLAPGTYQLDGRYKGKLAGPRGLKWRVVCADGNNDRVGESPMLSGPAPTWKDFNFAFSVPATGCRAQHVRLDFDARMASEQLVTGTMLFDQLHIFRVSNQPPSQPSSN